MAMNLWNKGNNKIELDNNLVDSVWHSIAAFCKPRLNLSLR
jgi:hypothetical protein